MAIFPVLFSLRRSRIAYDQTLLNLNDTLNQRNTLRNFKQLWYIKLQEHNMFKDYTLLIHLCKFKSVYEFYMKETSAVPLKMQIKTHEVYISVLLPH